MGRKIINKMEPTKEINVVIIGGLHHNTLGVIRALGEMKIASSNIDVILVEHNINKKNFIAKSKYISSGKIRYLNEYDEIIGQLLEIARDRKKHVIICCSDGAAETVISHREELQEVYFLPSTEMNVTELMQKDIQTNIARNEGIKVPESMVVGIHEDFEWSKYPCITKPIKSVLGAGKADIKISKNADELKKALSDTDAECVQIQEFLSKEMEFQLIGCSINKGEEIIIPGYTRIVRQPKNTNTGYLEYVPIDKLDNFDKRIVERFIRRIGYSGLFSMEFIRDKKGNDYFLEINMRNDGNAYCVTCAGVNLPYIWSYYGTYHEIPSVNLNFNKNIWFIPDFEDVRIGIKECGLFLWLKQFVGAKAHSMFSIKDIKPFVYRFWMLILMKIKK